MVDVNPGNGKIYVNKQTGINNTFYLKDNKNIIVYNNKLLLMSSPDVGFYLMNLYSLSGKKIKIIHSGFKKRKTISIPLKCDNIGKGCYFIVLIINGNRYIRQITYLK